MPRMLGASTLPRVHHDYEKESGGYTVNTYRDDRRVYTTWTAGNKRDAGRVAADHEDMLSGRDIFGCCKSGVRCEFHAGAKAVS